MVIMDENNFQTMLCISRYFRNFELKLVTLSKSSFAVLYVGKNEYKWT